MMKRGSGIAALIVLTVFLFSFLDNGTRNIANLRNDIKSTVQPAKHSFFVARGTPTTCKDFLKPILQPTQGGLLRGVGFGMPKEQVLQNEGDKVMQEADFKLVYDYGLEEEVKVLLTYDFNHSNQLDVVSIDYFSPDDLTTTCIMNEYVVYFNDRYGAAKKDADGYLTWEIGNVVQENQRMAYDIFLKDISTRDDAGVSLQFVAHQAAMP